MDSTTTFKSRNVGMFERIATMAFGAGLITYGIARQRTWPTLFATLTGAGLLARGITGRSPLYKMLGINTARARGQIASENFVAAEHMIRIDRPQHEVYSFCRDFHNLPKFMKHVSDVRVDGNQVEWIARLANQDFSWRSQLHEDVPDERLVWRSVPGSPVQGEIELTFKPVRDGGTAVNLQVCYSADAGMTAAALAPFFRTIGRYRLGRDLRRLKNRLEGDMEGYGRYTAQQWRTSSQRTSSPSKGTYESVSEPRLRTEP